MTGGVPVSKAGRSHRPVERIDAERERVRTTKPAGDRRLEPLDEVPSHVQERDARGTEEVLQISGDHEINAERMNVYLFTYTRRPRLGKRDRNSSSDNVTGQLLQSLPDLTADPPSLYRASV